MSTATCTYTEGRSDGYGKDWKTECGEDIRMETPEEVGPCFPPKPNAYGKFCPYCGKRIVLQERKHG